MWLLPLLKVIPVTTFPSSLSALAGTSGSQGGRIRGPPVLGTGGPQSGHSAARCGGPSCTLACCTPFSWPRPSGSTLCLPCASCRSGTGINHSPLPLSAPATSCGTSCTSPPGTHLAPGDTGGPSTVAACPVCPWVLADSIQQGLLLAPALALLGLLLALVAIPRVANLASSIAAGWPVWQ
jgi:hypothetical protein